MKRFPSVETNSQITDRRLKSANIIQLSDVCVQFVTSVWSLGGGFVNILCTDLKLMFFSFFNFSMVLWFGVSIPRDVVVCSVLYAQYSRRLVLLCHFISYLTFLSSSTICSNRFIVVFSKFFFFFVIRYAVIIAFRQAPIWTHISTILKSWKSNVFGTRLNSSQ